MEVKPHFLNVLNSFVLSFVNGDANRKVFMPNLIMRGEEPSKTLRGVKGIC